MKAIPKILILALISFFIFTLNAKSQVKNSKKIIRKEQKSAKPDKEHKETYNKKVEVTSGLKKNVTKKNVESKTEIQSDSIVYFTKNPDFDLSTSNVVKELYDSTRPVAIINNKKKDSIKIKRPELLPKPVIPQPFKNTKTTPKRSRKVIIKNND